MSGNLKVQLAEFLRVKADADHSKRTSQPYTDFYNKNFIELKKLSKSYTEDKTLPTTAGEKPENKTKNRYKDILPFDETRVVLDKTNGDPHSDYINANFIKDVYGKQHYIAAQGPMPTTLSDFWRMIWKYKIKVVVMACNEYEGIPGRLRCKRYWANSKDEPLVIEDIGLTVSFEDSHRYERGEYLVRKLKAQRNGETRKLIQIHYESWPDHGVPTSPFPLLDMIAETREYLPSAREGPPLLVHCSAGCGRTGTILVIDYCWNLIRTAFSSLDGQPFNLHHLILNMRKQRPTIVQSVDQYEFVYEAVSELFGRQLAAIDDNVYENVSDKEEESDISPGEEDIYENCSFPEQTASKPKVVSKPGARTLHLIQSCAASLAEEAGNSGTNGDTYAVPKRKGKPPITNARPTRQTSADRPSIPAKPTHSPKSSTDTTEPLYSLATEGLDDSNSRSSSAHQARKAPQSSALSSATPSDKKHVTIINVTNSSGVAPTMSSEYSEPIDLGKKDEYSMPYNSGPSNLLVKVRSPKDKVPPTEAVATGSEYSYADPNNPHKWSLQAHARKFSLKKGKQENVYSSVQGAEYEDIDASRFRGNRPDQGGAKPKGHQKATTPSSEHPPALPERPSDLTKSSASRSLSNSESADYKKSFGRSAGKKFKDIMNETFSNILDLPKPADPNVKTTGQAEPIHCNGEEIGFPHRISYKPHGPRNPTTFKLPTDFVTRM